MNRATESREDSRHEGGFADTGYINSHFIECASAWSDPANNYGGVAEAIVTGNVDGPTFDDTVHTTLAVVTTNLAEAYKPEPCAPNMDDACAQSRSLTYYCIQ